MRRIKHVFALFDSRDEAGAAYADIRAGGCATEHCSAMLHEHHIEEINLHPGERASGEGARKGGAAGGTLGVLLGSAAVLGGGILGVGPLATVAMAGGILTAYGAVLGGIAASDEPEKHIRALAKSVEEGKILVAVETDDPALERMCETVFEEHRGQKLEA